MWSTASIFRYNIYTLYALRRYVYMRSRIHYINKLKCFRFVDIIFVWATAAAVNVYIEQHVCAVCGWTTVLHEATTHLPFFPSHLMLPFSSPIFSYTFAHSPCLAFYPLSLTISIIFRQRTCGWVYEYFRCVYILRFRHVQCESTYYAWII